MAEDKFNGTDISEDILDSIAGGMTEIEKANIDAYVFFGKKSGMSLEKVLSKFDFLADNEDADEYYGYITQYYNSLQF